MTEERQNRIIELYKAGFGVLEVARMVKCKNDVVCRVLHRAGIMRYSKGSLGSIVEDRICTLYRNGTSMPEIAVLVELSLARVRVVLAKHDIDTSPKRFMIPEQIEHMLEMYANKYTASEIADELNVTPGLIYKELKRAGETRNWSGPKANYIRYAGKNGRLSRFRSTWEVVFARYLDSQGLEWAYESHTWLLSDGTAYTPDFWVPSLNIYFEVKGWMRERSARKLKLFRAEYPTLHLELVDKDRFQFYGIDLPTKQQLLDESYRDESSDAEMSDPLPSQHGKSNKFSQRHENFPCQIRYGVSDQRRCFR